MPRGLRLNIKPSVNASKEAIATQYQLSAQITCGDAGTSHRVDDRVFERQWGRPNII
jgi:hypothetical protein